MSAPKHTAGEWDRSLVYQMLRERVAFYRDQIDALRAEEASLQPKGCIGDDLEAIRALEKRIAVIEENGGDAATLILKRDAIKAEVEKNAPQLSAVRERWAAAAECLKMVDRAHESIHWLCFSEPKYAAIAKASGEGA